MAVYLSVDTLGLYVETARMATALGENAIPFELIRAEEIFAALRGEDWVEVGPFHGQLALEELERRRPGAAVGVAWDPVPKLRARNENRAAPKPTSAPSRA